MCFTIHPIPTTREAGTERTPLPSSAPRSGYERGPLGLTAPAPEHPQAAGDRSPDLWSRRRCRTLAAAVPREQRFFFLFLTQSPFDLSRLSLVSTRMGKAGSGGGREQWKKTRDEERGASTSSDRTGLAAGWPADLTRLSSSQHTAS